MLRAASVRRRLDDLRARFDGAAAPTAGEVSPSVEVAVARLSSAVDRHFARQDAVQLTADQLVHALDVVPQGIVLADAEGKVVFRNRAASGFFVARHSEALVESAMAELIAAAVAGAATTRTLELYGPPKRALQLRAVPLEDEEVGGVPRRSGAFLVVDDVSERQRLDTVRRDFVANISHELKTPVGALGVLAEALSEEDDPEIVHRLAERMQQEAFRVARTIDDLLQLSQIEASELPSRDPVPVHLLLAEAVDRTRAAAEIQGVGLVATPCSPDLTVVGDRRQLVSALANLCDNAVKYSDRGAEVTLAARADGADGADGAWVEIDVADQGIGIPGSDLERVFERFYRVDRARSRDTGGTGLGLAIVRHVVQNHEGSVTVRSREGEGSTFTLRLPAALALPSATSPAADDATPDLDHHRPELQADPPRKAAG